VVISSEYISVWCVFTVNGIGKVSILAVVEVDFSSNMSEAESVRGHSRNGVILEYSSDVSCSDQAVYKVFKVGVSHSWASVGVQIYLMAKLLYIYCCEDCLGSSKRVTNHIHSSSGVLVGKGCEVRDVFI